MWICYAIMTHLTRNETHQHMMKSKLIAWIHILVYDDAWHDSEAFPLTAVQHWPSSSWQMFVGVEWDLKPLDFGDHDHWIRSPRLRRLCAWNAIFSSFKHGTLYGWESTLPIIHSPLCPTIFGFVWFWCLTHCNFFKKKNCEAKL